MQTHPFEQWGAGNCASVDLLHDALAKAGHRVAVLDGCTAYHA